MRLEEFEQLWLDRHSLSEDEGAKLLSAAKSNKEFSDFAEFGALTRKFVSDLPSVNVSDNFAWRMGVYAKNNPDASPKLSDSGGFKVASLASGIALGAVFVSFIISGNSFIDGSKTFQSDLPLSEKPETVLQSSDQAAMPVSRDLINTETSENLAAKSDSSGSETEKGVEENTSREIQNYLDPHVVSTTGQ